MLHDFSESLAETFFKIIKNEKIVVCGLESSSIPILQTMVCFSNKFNRNVKGIYIRKSRKKHDLFKQIEGDTKDVKEVILVDDVLNSGASIIKQIKILEEENIKVSKVFAILRYRDKDFYKFLTEKNIELISLFELNDFSKNLPVANIIDDEKNTFTAIETKTIWHKNYGPAKKNIVFSKSYLRKSGEYLYFGSDNGSFYCIDSKNGDVVWSRKILFGDHGKMIFSTPCFYENIVFFGAYDGNFYALDKYTGKVIWIYKDADWIGSSPTVSVKNKMVFIGLEFGLWKKRGGIIALNVLDGKTIWENSHPSLTHSSPHVSEKYNVLLCGSNDGILRIYNLTNGKPLKEIQTVGEIKMHFTENEENDLASFGTCGGGVYVLDLKKLELSFEIRVYEDVLSDQCWEKNFLYASALDKRIYKFDTVSGKKIWELQTGGRVFASPILVSNFIYCGSNDGRIYKINKENGKVLGFIQTTERITEPVLFYERDAFVKDFNFNIYRINFDIY